MKNFINVKVCRKCELPLNINDFSSHSSGKFKVRSVCKLCSAIDYKIYRAANPEKELLKLQNWRASNPEKSRQQSRDWDSKNRGRRKAIKAKRRANLLNATPNWVKDSDLDPYYFQAVELSHFLGISMEVDHIHPLTHDDICGLHIPANLQIIPLKQNRKKSNKFTPYVESEGNPNILL